MKEHILHELEIVGIADLIHKKEMHMTAGLQW